MIKFYTPYAFIIRLEYKTKKKVKKIIPLKHPSHANFEMHNEEHEWRRVFLPSVNDQTTENLFDKIIYLDSQLVSIRIMVNKKSEKEPIYTYVLGVPQVYVIEDMMFAY